MADSRELIPVAQRRGAQTILKDALFAVIAQPVPLSDTDSVFVVVPELDLNSKFGPCHWQPRITNQTINVAQGAEAADNFVVGRLVLPALGDEALVVFDNRRNPWVVMWWPT